MKKIMMAVLFAGFTMGVQAHSVAYNTNSRIYHKHNCEWAQKCTKNCITIDSREAQQRGGRPCKVCGG